jgi:error-prone DNA polymerase
VGHDGLERLAWAGACDSLGDGRREALWRLGIARGVQRSAVGGRAGEERAEAAQLPLPLSLPGAPALRELDPWERLVADYASTGIALREHPMELMRPELNEGLARSADLLGLPDRGRLEIAGLVVARQRPATAKGVVFMLLEDETGTVNVVVPPPVYERDRLAVRAAAFVRIAGRLERREGVVNVVASAVEALARPDLPLADVRHIEPPAKQETGREPALARPAEQTDLAAVAPRAHSFGRRGR